MNMHYILLFEQFFKRPNLKYIFLIYIKKLFSYSKNYIMRQITCYTTEEENKSGKFKEEKGNKNKVMSLSKGLYTTWLNKLRKKNFNQEKKNICKLGRICRSKQLKKFSYSTEKVGDLTNKGHTKFFSVMHNNRNRACIHISGLLRVRSFQDGKNKLG